MLPDRAAVITEAETWLGTPFHEGCHIRGIGVSCGQLLIAVYGSLGFPVPVGNLGYFPLDWALHTREERYLTILEHFATHTERPEPGNIALFRLFGHRAFSHSAIIVEWPARVIHALWGRGVEWADASKEPLVKRPVQFFDPWALATA